MHQSRQDNWDVALCVIRYIKSTPGQVLLLRVDSILQLRAFCDSDWANYAITRHSLNGFFVSLGQSPNS